MPHRKRLGPEKFDLPAERLSAGFYSDKYFVRTRDILHDDQHHAIVTMQVFCRSAGLLAGMDEAIAILKVAVDPWSDLDVKALYDGDAFDPWETAMTIEGPLELFAHVETLILGVLARRTRIATATHQVVIAADGKEVMYFAARHDHFLTQPGDGYAAKVGGATDVSTDAQALTWDGLGAGTIPHALIAAYAGDTLLATQKFAEHIDSSVRVIALVDFDNDCVNTSLKVARALGDRLGGVRLDTSASLVDKSLQSLGDDPSLHGVNAKLVRLVRDALDQAGFNHVRIIVSGGFTPDRIRAFESGGVPCDGYGVGSSILANQGEFDFTADVVLVDGKPCAKVGRNWRPNKRLDSVT